jgi:hypothetical protein
MGGVWSVDDQNEPSLRLALAPFLSVEVLEFWRTADRHPGRARDPTGR